MIYAHINVVLLHFENKPTFDEQIICVWGGHCYDLISFVSTCFCLYMYFHEGVPLVYGNSYDCNDVYLC